MAEPVPAVEAALEEAANEVISAHGIAIDDGESCLEAFGWALGNGIGYGQGLGELAQAIVDTFDLPGLIASRIELLSEYKLDYPRDYEADDVARMRAEIQQLQSLQQRLENQP
ncbi:hypothetical protein ACFRAU_07275 [Arthrobacter sp. NPDC056691]|uniref:hypothetical protein n=1 Tax=Arthrobacter sp. NPDC056691 TaxID=3345913 RepID=UPI00366EFD94